MDQSCLQIWFRQDLFLRQVFILGPQTFFFLSHQSVCPRKDLMMDEEYSKEKIENKCTPEESKEKKEINEIEIHSF